MACGLDGRLRHGLVEAEAGQHAAGIGADLDAGADLAEFRLALGDDDAETGGRQRQRRRQSADAGAGDDDRVPFAAALTVRPARHGPVQAARLR